MPSVAAALVVVGALAAATASTTSASTAAVVSPAKPTPPAVVPHHGRPFVPVQGDWEGTAGGFAASFNLVLDAARQQRAGVPRYGISDLVILRPRDCPPDSTHYSESIISGRLPSALGNHGDLGLRNFGLGGALTGKRSATLESHYSLASCHATLTWHMHPAVRQTVANGSWTLHYSSGERSTFHVQGGGRLASSIRLPSAIVGCNGLQGTVDVFIGTQGRASFAQSGVGLALRFANGHATGTLSASGCAGPLRLTATHSTG
ncbi:MAG TPA: hypothetical protein VMF14_19715 [Solirubrobacteraceae bacterium]|nr:hypothetical protein [Solirubrobacteraceae bacterium]